MFLSFANKYLFMIVLDMVLESGFFFLIFFQNIKFEGVWKFDSGYKLCQKHRETVQNFVLYYLFLGEC